ncbi:MAG: DUF4158 domain-containing protein [Acetobacteraceae bacterium]
MNPVVLDPGRLATMTRHYVFDAADPAIVRARHRASNRLDFAVQLCVLHHPGRRDGSTSL